MWSLAIAWTGLFRNSLVNSTKSVGQMPNCHWKFHAGQASKQKSFSITVLRWQLPLAPANQKHYTRYKAWRRNLALKPTGHFLLTCLQKTKWLATYVMLSRPRVKLFSRQLRIKGPRNCAAISSIYVMCMLLSSPSVLNELRFKWNHVLRLHGARFDEILFLQSSVQTCIRIVETEDLQHAQINKGWLLDISLLLGLYAGLIIDALHFIFTLDRWAGHWFFGSQHLVLRYLSPSLCFNLFLVQRLMDTKCNTKQVSPTKFLLQPVCRHKHTTYQTPNAPIR